MKKVAAILLCTVLLLSCLGCSMYDLKGIRLKGALRTETMQSEDPCQKIVIKDLSFYDSASCNITIANGPSVSVQTNLPEDLYGEYGFTVSLQDGILLLTTAESLEFSLEEPAQIHITAPFNTLEVEGEFVVLVDAEGMENFHLLSQDDAVVTVQNLNTQMTEIAASGGSEVYLSGKTDMFSGSSRGLSEVYARNLISSTADLYVSGMGEITISVEDLLQADISGFGDVFYYGSPHVQESTSGLGDVTQQAIRIPEE